MNFPTDLGEKKLKNIARPLRVYSVKTSPTVSRCATLNVPMLKIRIERTQRLFHHAPLTNLPNEVRLPLRSVRIRTAEEAIKFIDRNLTGELLRLPVGHLPVLYLSRR
jgi:hypothetical protein